MANRQKRRYEMKRRNLEKGLANTTNPEKEEILKAKLKTVNIKIAELAKGGR